MSFIGFDIDHNKLMISLIEKNHKKISSHSFPLQKVSPQIFSIAKITATSLPAKDCLLKKLCITAPKKHLKKLLPFQLESLTSLSAQKQIARPYFLKTSNSAHHFSVFLSSKEALERYQNFLKNNLHITPDLMTSAALALTQFSQKFTNHTEGFILHIKEKESLFLYMENSQPLFFRTLPFGSALYSRDPDSYDQSLHKYLQQFFHNEKFSPAPLLITGNISKITSSFSDFFSSFIPCDSNAQKYALSIGLALLANEKGTDTVQFLSNGCFQQGIVAALLKRVFIPITWTLSLIFIALSSYFFGQHKKIIDNEEQTLFQLEKKFFNKEPRSLMELHKKIAVTSAHFPYPFKAYAVSEVLFRLQKIFNLEEIEKFHYQMESFPSKEKRKNPYKIKISLHIKNALSKEEILHQLVHENLIDPKEEILWKKERDCSIIAFYLKKPNVHE